MDSHYCQAERQARETINQLLSQHFSAEQVAELSIEYPPENIGGDFAVGCFALAKSLKQSPAHIAETFVSAAGTVEGFEKVEANGPYINFYVKRVVFSELVLKEIFKQKANFGNAKIGKGKKIMIEYFSPNTNKPLTVGHLRNIALGWSVARLFKKLGYKVLETTLYNDRGIAIAKAMVAYMKWGKNKTPKDLDMKPDAFVGKYYVEFGKQLEQHPELEKQAQKLLLDWEQGKKEVMQLWQKMMGWVLEGFKITLAKLHIDNFDQEYYESEYYSHGKEIVEQGLKAGYLKEHKEGYIYADLEQYGLPNKILLRSDGTALYMTQDLYLAFLKNKHQLDESIYVVGNEQDNYFRQLFKILELLHFENIKKNYHLSYGMVRLPEGRIKSRDGSPQGTSADDIIDTLVALAREEIVSRDAAVSDKEVEKRAEQIAIGALKFFLLGSTAQTTMIFNPRENIAFTGRTGPYVQYVNARISRLFEKAGTKKRTTRVDFNLLTDEYSFALIKQLSRFPVTLLQAVERHDPAALSQYVYDLSRQFATLYEIVPITSATTKQRAALLLLLDCVQQVIQESLYLLGIESPERM